MFLLCTAAELSFAVAFTAYKEEKVLTEELYYTVVCGLCAGSEQKMAPALER